MLNSQEVKDIYKEIQKKLFYMIPEKWDKVFLYASITEKAYTMPIGEMFFYYFPKSLLKKNPVNVYEIPIKFNIDEKQYMKLVKNLYGSISSLWKVYKDNKQKMWTNITIAIENHKFKIEYNYDILDFSKDASYERHIVWRYNYLNLDINTISKKERKIIENYLVNNQASNIKSETYEEGIYKNPVENILAHGKLKKYEDSLKLQVMEDFEIDRKPVNNQILTGLNKK